MITKTIVPPTHLCQTSLIDVVPLGQLEIGEAFQVALGGKPIQDKQDLGDRMDAYISGIVLDNEKENGQVSIFDLDGGYKSSLDHNILVARANLKLEIPTKY